ESDCLSSAETRLATRKKNWRLDGRKDQTVSATGSMIQARLYYICFGAADDRFRSTLSPDLPLAGWLPRCTDRPYLPATRRTSQRSTAAEPGLEVARGLLVEESRGALAPSTSER